MQTNKDSHIIEALLIAAIVVVLAVVGWRVWEFQAKSTDISNQGIVESQPEAPEVSQADDLDKAATVIDELNLDSNDEELAELEKDLEAL
jgi:regulatory protein YycH of two-component signal transduction system YycFG